MGCYIRSRCNNASTDSATRVLSSLLTFPLTLRYSIHQLGDFISKKPSLNVLVIGARGESSLPLIWWKELLHGEEIAGRKISITMMGPDLQIQKMPKSSIINYSTKELQWIAHPDNKTTLHLHSKCNELLQWADIFMLYNSGFGSNVLKSRWDPTIRLLLHTRKPIVCTSHGALDMNRDLAQLRVVGMEEDFQELGNPIEFVIPPHVNPFRSSKLTIDENEETEAKVITTNHSLFCFRFK